MTMSTEILNSEIQSVINRLNRLEKQNSRIKRLGLLALLCIISASVIAQTLPKRRVIEGEEFVLRGTDGKIRGKLEAADDSTNLVLYDSNGEVRVNLSTSRSQYQKSWSSGLSLVSETGRAAHIVSSPDDVALWFANPGPIIRSMAVQLRASDGDSHLALSEKGIDFAQSHGRLAAVELSASGEGPFLTLTDKGSFNTTIGVTSLITPKTGDTHKKSAASVVMCDKDGAVIWSAP